MILSLDDENMIKTITSAPNSDMLQWILPELKILGSSLDGWEKFWIFDKIFIEE